MQVDFVGGKQWDYVYTYIYFFHPKLYVISIWKIVIIAWLSFFVGAKIDFLAGLFCNRHKPLIVHLNEIECEQIE